MYLVNFSLSFFVLLHYFISHNRLYVVFVDYLFFFLHFSQPYSYRFVLDYFLYQFCFCSLLFYLIHQTLCCLCYLFFFLQQSSISSATCLYLIIFCFSFFFFFVLHYFISYSKFFVACIYQLFFFLQFCHLYSYRLLLGHFQSQFCFSSSLFYLTYQTFYCLCWPSFLLQFSQFYSYRFVPSYFLSQFCIRSSLIYLMHQTLCAFAGHLISFFSSLIFTAKGLYLVIFSLSFVIIYIHSFVDNSFFFLQFSQSLVVFLISALICLCSSLFSHFMTKVCCVFVILCFF